MVLLNIIILRGDGFPTRSQRNSLDGVERSVTTEEEGDKSLGDRSGPADHAICPVTSLIFSQMHDIICNKSLYTLTDEKYLWWIVVE